jgi:predicted nucleic acid-binding protein
MTDDVFGGQYHQPCSQLVEKGLKGELDYLLAVNPVIVVDFFSALRRILSCNEAESRVSLLLRSRRIVFLPISKEECQRAIQWAKEKNIPVNDALIGANALQYAQLIYTVDEDHFGKLGEFGVKLINPAKETR